MLAVAENAETFSLIRSALTDLGSGLDVQRVKSGQHALQFLQKRSPHERVEMPRLVIIDCPSRELHSKWNQRLTSEIRKRFLEVTNVT